MAVQGINKQELETKLEEIVNVLIKKGLMPPLSEKEKKDLTKQVADTLINDPKVSLSKEDLAKDNVQKTLGIACMAQLLHKNNPNHKFDYTVFFKKQLEIEPKELQKELKLLFTNVLKMNPSYQNKKQDEKALMEADVNQLTKKMTEMMKENNELLLKNDKVMGLAMAGIDMLSEQRRSLYGVDTHQPGSVFIPVQAVPFGDQMGVLDLAALGGESFLSKRDDPNPNIPDPTGARMASILNYIADGQTTKAELEFMEKIMPDTPAPTVSTTPNPFSTKPSPLK